MSMVAFRRVIVFANRAAELKSVAAISAEIIADGVSE